MKLSRFTDGQIIAILKQVVAKQYKLSLKSLKRQKASFRMPFTISHFYNCRCLSRSLRCESWLLQPGYTCAARSPFDNL